MPKKLKPQDREKLRVAVRRRKRATERTFKSPKTFAAKLLQLHEKRRKTQRSQGPRLSHLHSTRDRRTILAKTGSRCHVCGGRLKIHSSHMDHVVAYGLGGRHPQSNFLAAHEQCNMARWDFGPEEWRHILKLGIFVRAQVEDETHLGVELAQAFIEKERGRIARQVNAKARLRVAHR